MSFFILFVINFLKLFTLTLELFSKYSKMSQTITTIEKIICLLVVDCDRLLLLKRYTAIDYDRLLSLK